MRFFLKKLHSYIGDSFNVFVIWNTSKIRSLFPLKVALNTQMLLYCFVYFAYLSLGVGSLKLASCTGMIECDKLIFYFLQHIFASIKILLM